MNAIKNIGHVDLIFHVHILRPQCKYVQDVKFCMIKAKELSIGNNAND